MKNNFNVTTINDEISDDINETVEFLKSRHIKFVEIRTVNKKSLVDYSTDEIKKIYYLLHSNGIEISALASPLFKWYPENVRQESIEKVDTFNFNPQLSLESKKSYIRKAIETAKILKTNNIRIFSSLRSPSGYYNFAEDPLLNFALDEAQKSGVNLLLENEPPCYIHKMDDIKRLTKKYSSEDLGIWFDVANFYKIHEQVLLEDLKVLKEQIKYIHLKDFDIDGNYVPFGQGIINYKRIISDIKKIFNKKDVFLSIETHVHSNPKRATAESINKLNSLLFEKRLGYGIIGCGQVFTKHGSAISNNEKSELRAVFDIDQKRAIESATRFDCEVKSTLESMLDDEDIDVINIRTPNDTHTDLVLRIIKRGKKCLCEKPLCLTVKDGNRILRSKAYKKGIVVVNFQNRFNPSVSKLFDLLETGKLGKILFCSIDVRWWRDDSYFKDWHGDKNRVGGMLYNQGAHALDIMYKVCGPLNKIKKVSKNLRKVVNIDDIYLAIIEFKNGILGRVEITTYTKYRDCEASIFVIGDKGSIKLSGSSFNEIEFISTEEDILSTTIISSEPQPEHEDSHFKLIKALNEFLITGQKDDRLAHAEDGMIVTDFIEKLYK